ncbi:MAG: hypothetical protein L0H73_08150 [Nitrococcus sp.]|nr:hypothetical protein [Nitrococcus sp.]
MSLEEGWYFQRGMSLVGEVWVDHPSYGDRHERAKADHADSFDLTLELASGAASVDPIDAEIVNEISVATKD